jgi:Ca2+-binding RTX toxin-like protein
MSEINGTDQAERLDGTSGNDTISAFGGNDTIAGLAGNDRIITGDGVDVVDGGAGNDEINGFMIDASIGYYNSYSSTGAKTLSGGEDNDAIFGGSEADLINGGVGNDQMYGAAGADVINGGDGADTLYGQDGNDTLDGGDGIDNVTGGAGSDSLVGGAGDDFLYDQETGTDTLQGGAGNDTLNIHSGTGNKTLDGGDGKDSLTGGTGNDTLDGGAGDDFLMDQGSGADRLIGGAGNDDLNAYTGTGNKYLDGGDGNDTLSAGTGADTLLGGAGNDELNGLGGGSDKKLDGGDGNDTLLGGSTNDTLTGGLGIDELHGGAGNDVYYVSDMTDYIFDSGGADTAYVSKSFVKLPSSIETVIYTDGALALPYWISALMFNSGAGLNDATLLGSAKTFKYAFPGQLPTYYSGTSQADGSFVGFSDIQKTRTVVALNYIETVIDVKFVLETDTTVLNSAKSLNTLSFGTNAQTNSAGYAFGPSSRSDGNDVFLNKTEADVKDLAEGTYGSQILIHEIGHALGLKHPFEKNGAANDSAEPPYLTGNEDNTLWSVMSYNDDPIGQTSLKYSPLDIAALQYIYGPSTSARTTADTYVISETEANFIWDGGGTDKISAASSSKAVTIYMEPGYWGYVGTAKAEKITTAGQITVNFGSQIENLDGSSLGDSLYGNALANAINGNAGADTITGNGGNDTIDGGDGQDTVVYALNASNYTVTANASGVYQVLAKTGVEGTDSLSNVEYLKFADQTAVIANFVGQEVVPVGAKFWKDNTKAPTGLKKSDAVNLTEEIAILKMIVGLNVNSNNTPLSPSQAIAADFDQSGDVGLTDAIGVLKMVVGLTAPSPTWKYYDETKLTNAYTATQSLNPKAWTSTAVISDTDTVASSVKLIGVLTGDVDGSWTGV